MPVDRYHAFSSSVTASVDTISGNHVMSFFRRNIARFRHYMEQIAAQQAAERFDQRALLGKNCRFGSRAWCANRGPRENIKLGEFVVCRGILRSETFHSGKLLVGDYVYIGDDCLISCAEEIVIGSFTLLAHGVQIFDNDSHPISPLLRERDYRTIIGLEEGGRLDIARKPIRIGEHAWIGFNAIITKGVMIGDGSIVAPGSVVTSDVPDFSIVAGNPARVVKEIRDHVSNTR